MIGKIRYSIDYTAVSRAYSVIFECYIENELFRIVILFILRVHKHTLVYTQTLYD